MQENIKKPAIRFDGFTDAWEQRKVYELIEDYIERTTVQNQYPVLTSSQQYGIVRQEDYFADRQVTTSDNIGYYVLPFGYFTYRSRSDTDLFVFNRNTLINKGIISYYYPVFKAKNCDSNFLLRRLNHGIRQQLAMAAEGTGQKVLAHSKFKNMVIDVPSQREQERIGLVFEQIDSLITLHQRKYAKLVNIKKSMLEKMFPKDGEVVPEIRFAGFTDAWEQREFGEIVIRSSEMSNDYSLPRVEYEDIISGIGLLNKDITKKMSCKVGLAFHDGDVLYGKLRPYLKNWLLPSFSGIAVGDFWVMKPQEADSSFVYRLIQTQQFDEIANQSTGTKMPRADWKLVSKSLFRVPSSIHEQAKIGHYFSALDDLITLHQRKLERLQNIKKSCLEKMFV